MMSFELLLDPVTDARIRAEWDALLAAGLPSQARHAGASNAPHITLLAAGAVDSALAGVDRADASAPLLPLPLDVAVHPGALVVFGAPPRGLVLARLVALGRPLQALHTNVHRRASGAVDVSQQTTPDHWTPHITLASRLTPAQLAVALEVLAVVPRAAPSPDAPQPLAVASALAVALRHWDGDTKAVTMLDP